MKLMYFSNQTLPKNEGGGRITGPRVSFGKKGMIYFNRAASSLLDLKEGNKITLAQDQEDPAGWYFFKDAQHGFELKLHSDKKGYWFSHQALRKELLSSFDKPQDINHNFPISAEPTVMKGDKVKYWKLLILVEEAEG